MLLMAFTSQTMAASTMRCRQLSDSTMHVMNDMPGMQAMMEMDGMEDMHHDMSAMMSEKTASHNCCNLPGHCASGGCSLVVFATAFDFAVLLSRMMIFDNHANTPPESFITSLYRPPIFR